MIEEPDEGDSLRVIISFVTVIRECKKIIRVRQSKITTAALGPLTRVIH